MEAKINLIFIILFTSLMKFQDKVDGRYNPALKFYETRDTTYWIDYFRDGVARISKDGYMGLIDTSGVVLCQTKYDMIYDFEGDVARVGLNGKYGLIDKNGNELIAPRFSKLGAFKNGLAVSEEKLYRVIKKDGTFLGSKSYDYLSSVKDGGFAYVEDNKIGYINNMGNEITSLDDYKSLIDKKIIFSYGDEYFLEKNGRRNRLFEYNDGLTVIPQRIEGEYKFGYIDQDARIVIPAIYECADKFINGYACVQMNGRWGVINKHGNTVVPFLYETISQIDKSRFIVSQKGMYGVVDTNNNVLVSASYPYLSYLFDDLFVTHNNKHWGVVNIDGKLVLPYKYAGAMRVSNSRGVITLYEKSRPLNTAIPRFLFFGKFFYFDKSGILDRKGHAFQKTIEGVSGMYTSDLKLKSSTMFMPDDMFIDAGREFDLKYRLRSGLQIVGKVSRESSGPLSDAVTTKRYLKGIANDEGKIIVPIIYDDLIDVGLNVFVARVGQKYGLIDHFNKTIIPWEYDFLKIISGVIVARVKAGNSDSSSNIVFDLTGKTIIPLMKREYKEGNAGALVGVENLREFLINKDKNK
jgi:hypothetical protein